MYIRTNIQVGSKQSLPMACACALITIIIAQACLLRKIHIYVKIAEFIANFAIHECIITSSGFILLLYIRGASFVVVLCSPIDNKFITFILLRAYWLFEGRSAHQFESKVFGVLACKRVLFVWFLKILLPVT